MLSDVSFRFPSGKITALVGLSGSGKSTILKVDLAPFRSGRRAVTVGGMDVKDDAARRAPLAHGKRVAVPDVHRSGRAREHAARRTRRERSGDGAGLPRSRHLGRARAHVARRPARRAGVARGRQGGALRRRAAAACDRPHAACRSAHPASRRAGGGHRRHLRQPHRRRAAARRAGPHDAARRAQHPADLLGRGHRLLPRGRQHHRRRHAGGAFRAADALQEAHGHAARLRRRGRVRREGIRAGQRGSRRLPGTGAPKGAPGQGRPARRVRQSPAHRREWRNRRDPQGSRRRDQWQMRKKSARA